MLVASKAFSSIRLNYDLYRNGDLFVGYILADNDELIFHKDSRCWTYLQLRSIGGSDASVLKSDYGCREV